MFLNEYEPRESILTDNYMQVELWLGYRYYFSATLRFSCINSVALSIFSNLNLPLLLFTHVSFTQHRNQRMADDQSVLGRRRIYYDQHGSEALICSDSEEDLVQLDGEKREFSEGEDRLMRSVRNMGVVL